MILSIVIVIAAVFALVAILWLTVARSTQVSPFVNGAPQIRPIDVEAFRNLVDPAEAAYLRERLPARQFRRVQRSRLLATAAYVQEVSRNAAVLVRMGQSAMAVGDPRVKESARQLVENALLLRRNAAFALVRIYVTLAIPAGGIGAAPVAESYERLSMAAMLLGRLQSPGTAVRLSSIR